MSDNNSVFDDVQEYVFGTRTPLDDLGNAVVNNYNQGIGYVKGRYDEMQILAPEPNESYPYIKVEQTPIYTIGKMFGPEATPSTINEASKVADILIMYDEALQLVDSIELELGEDYIQSGPWAEMAFPNQDINPDEYFTVDEVRIGLQTQRNLYSELGANLSQTGVEGVNIESITMIEAFQAFSPLSVALAGIKPSLTRELMGLHLLGDALTGVMNFRSPTGNAGYGLLDFFAPYIAMTGAAVANKVSSTVEYQ